MGRLFVENLEGPKIFKCKYYKVDSASRDNIVSKDFRGRYGQAYLYRHVVNISIGPSEERDLMTGLHTVNDIYCSAANRFWAGDMRRFMKPAKNIEKDCTFWRGNGC